MALVIHAFELRHGPAVVELIGSVFAEYGMAFDPSDFDHDLLTIQTYYLDRGGWFFVLSDGGRVVGTVAALPQNGAECEIKRLYLRAPYRGRGWGRVLLEHILAQIGRAGYREAVAWSDVRLDTAHHVYARLGFARIGERLLDDIDRSREYGFRKVLAIPAPGSES